MLQKETCVVFQRLLSQVFILNIWKTFRESGSLQEGKVTKTVFVIEMFKQMKTYIGNKPTEKQFHDERFSYFQQQQFLQELCPEEYGDYVRDQKDKFQEILKRQSMGQSNDKFKQYFKRISDMDFDKWFTQNYDSQLDRMMKSTFKNLFDKWLEYNMHLIFEQGLFETWFQKKFTLLFEKIFERFSLESDDERIDIQDLVVSLAVLAQMELEQQLDLVFQLTDVDEDGCLSVQDILQMIKRIERNFMKETAYIQNDFYTLHHELAFRKAMRKFSWATLKISKQEKSDDVILIERKHFLNQLKQDPHLFNNFLPAHLQLYDVLMTDQNEREIKIFEDATQTNFEIFRKEMHHRLRNYQGDKLTKLYLQEYKGLVRYPGKVDQSGKKRLPRLEKLEEKKETVKFDTMNLKQTKANNIDAHQDRLSKMRLQGTGWNNILK